MSQSNLHNIQKNKSSKPTKNQSIIYELIELYKLWQNFLPHLSKSSRYSLGLKIDSLFIEIAEYIYTANYLIKKEKLPLLEKSSRKLDLIKFFLLICWEVKALDNKKYIVISKRVNKIGKMLGGWIKKTSALMQDDKAEE
jgi:hypothetical protein